MKDKDNFFVRLFESSGQFLTGLAAVFATCVASDAVETFSQSQKQTQEQSQEVKVILNINKEIAELAKVSKPHEIEKKILEAPEEPKIEKGRPQGLYITPFRKKALIDRLKKIDDEEGRGEIIQEYAKKSIGDFRTSFLKKREQLKDKEKTEEQDESADIPHE